jgi:hypothetical protein
MTKLGVAETKDAVIAGCKIYEAIKLAMVDGKFDMFDLAHLPPVMPAVIAAVKDARLIPAEMKDLDDGEFDELVGAAKSVIQDLTPDKYEAVVFGALALIKALAVAFL